MKKEKQRDLTPEIAIYQKYHVGVLHIHDQKQAAGNPSSFKNWRKRCKSSL